MNNVVAIVQCRMASTRLPGKVMQKINDKPMLWYVLNRLKQSKVVNQIVVATTRSAADTAVKNLAWDCEVRTYVGSELDVLDRYYQCASVLSAKTIVRITEIGRAHV